ncbi:DUF2382 domain-containing protein [Macrococcus sp. DPC7161]|uniref:DUF2382 domain-containing protein n=1 Tax=Macrococcus sp. DPC7161 TaxID=2507060 RepID=UPI00100AAEB7|nr:DUF2382 domain-containing protein [Macrococcus sp. DPC7161]RXK17239.1 DUF2382 domain-containing protein [Macrococcus sp. DPC7161]
MRKLEVLNNESELLERIEHYRLEGIAEHNMKVISHDRLEGSSLNYTDIEVKNAEGSFGDKVAAFFTGEDPEDRVFHHLNLQPNEEHEYVQAIEQHKIVLLVDENGFGEYDRDHHSAAAVGGLHSDKTIHENNEGDVNMSRDRDFLNRNENKYELDEDIRNRNDLTEEEKIKLHEERLLVNKDRVQTGEVKVEKDVVTERQEFDVPVEREEIVIERRPVNERTDGKFDELGEDEVIRVPVHEERINVSKENVVNEEIVIKKERVTDVEHVSEDVRREEVDIDESNRNGRL